MNDKKLLILVVASLLMIVPVIAPAFAAQPPIKLDEYWVGTIGQPRRVDPARAYDTASGELIQNVYEPLIRFKDKHPWTAPTASNNITEWYNSVYGDPEMVGEDLTAFEPVIAADLPTITYDDTAPYGKYHWTFTIRTDIRFQPWKDAGGNWHYDQLLTAEDVEYTFKRMLVQDMIGSPSWMLCLPLTGHMFFNEIDANKNTKPIEPIGVDGEGERLAAYLIDNSITRSGNTITFHLPEYFPEAAFMQILAQTWGCIVNKAFCIENGCWNGTFYDGWSADYRQQPSNSYSPLDRYYSAKSKYTLANSPVTLYGGAMCGTGPYKFDYWDKTTLTWYASAWEADANTAGYRGGWATPGTGPKSIKRIVVKGIAEWPTRKMMFLAGEFDSVAVPRANMYDLLSGADPYTPLAGIRLYYDARALSNDVASFVFRVADDTPYMPKVGGVNKPDFFNDTHIRKAFTHALNFTTYLRDAWMNEAIQPTSWWVDGLTPKEAKNTELVPKNLDYDLMESEFKAAGVWNSGFEVTICYNLGNDQRKIACEMIRDAIHALNARRPGLTPFKVEVVGLDWPVFLDYEEYMYMPMFFVGWLADFAHADNFARPYMHMYGDFAYFQGYWNEEVSDLIDEALTTTNETRQIEIYKYLQWVYSERDYPGLPLIQAVGRRWERDWVRGWYYNQLYPGLMFYDLYKTETVPPKPVDLSAVDTILDVDNWLIAHHGAADVEIAYPYGTEQTPAIPIWFHASRVDDGSQYPGLVGIVFAVVYINSTGYIVAIEAIPELLGPGDSVNETFTLNNPSLKLDVYTVQGRVYVFSSGAYDNNEANNIVEGGGFSAVWLLGDVNNDRYVEMMDFYEASIAFGTYPGHPRWNIRCDLYGEGGAATSPEYAGDEMIEMMDFYVLSIQFGQHLPM